MSLRLFEYVAPAPFHTLRFYCDKSYLCALILTGQSSPPPKGAVSNLILGSPVTDVPIETRVHRWLDDYFSGNAPAKLPPIRLTGTPFQLAVWQLLSDIPYGTTTTYGSLAVSLSKRRAIARMSAQAVGGAVGRNPVSILIPCHRVLGSDGSMTGYNGGIHYKSALLRIEALHRTLTKNG